mmetsp:Transcript_112543/g.325199  ORF Transcript_112543/g.325199 Transcript_112543/m.325199 type:complete len:294 (-) Transcript_112543:813-1694(-)
MQRDDGRAEGLPRVVLIDALLEHAHGQASLVPHRVDIILECRRVHDEQHAGRLALQDAQRTRLEDDPKCGRALERLRRLQNERPPRRNESLVAGHDPPGGVQGDRRAGAIRIEAEVQATLQAPRRLPAGSRQGVLQLSPPGVHGVLVLRAVADDEMTPCGGKRHFKPEAVAEHGPLPIPLLGALAQHGLRMCWVEDGEVDAGEHLLVTMAIRSRRMATQAVGPSAIVVAFGQGVKPVQHWSAQAPHPIVCSPQGYGLRLPAIAVRAQASDDRVCAHREDLANNALQRLNESIA